MSRGRDVCTAHFLSNCRADKEATGIAVAELDHQFLESVRQRMPIGQVSERDLTWFSTVTTFCLILFWNTTGNIAQKSYLMFKTCASHSIADMTYMVTVVEAPLGPRHMRSHPLSEWDSLFINYAPVKWDYPARRLREARVRWWNHGLATQWYRCPVINHQSTREDSQVSRC